MLLYRSWQKEKTGLAAAEYLQSEDDEVEFKRDLTYYWRVKASDGVNNEGEWSNHKSCLFCETIRKDFYPCACIEGLVEEFRECYGFDYRYHVVDEDDDE